MVLIPDLAGRNCLKIAEAPVEVGNLVNNKAFPCFKENKAWPQVRNGEVLIDTLIEGKLITEFRISKGNFLVTHGAEECNSGSPVFNSQGEIAGILHTVLTDGISMAVHMKRALDLMDASTKEVILDLNKECKAE